MAMIGTVPCLFAECIYNIPQQGMLSLKHVLGYVGSGQLTGCFVCFVFWEFFGDFVVVCGPSSGWCVYY